MKKSIVITSIFDPTDAVKYYAEIEGYSTIVVGDKKTPKDWQYDNIEYLSIDKQNEIGKHLNKMLPFNHYCRKMMGYLFAIKENSEVIIDTDDDNIPKKNWGFPEVEGNYLHVDYNNAFINIYQLFTKDKIWPRGLPLNLILKDFNLKEKLSYKISKIGIWQGLADGDPDVDAVYRLTDNSACYFEHHEPVVLQEGTISPFNTQNTMIIKELFPLLYLPAFVTFRFTDILRGLIAQPIMWQYGYKLGFIEATVLQNRNYHDYYEDFKSEIPMYLHGEKIIDIVKSSLKPNFSISENMFQAYHSILSHDIIDKREMPILEAWLKDIDN
jgi:hypothetical protein